VYFGETTHQLDAKGRVFVPKRFQEVLGGDAEGTRIAYLTRGQDSCLYLFSEAAFQAAQAELKTGVFTGQELRAVQRVFFANTVRIELDSSGRMLIPEKLRSKAGIDKEVVFVGVHDRAEIWAKDAWERYESHHQDLLDRIDQVLANRDPKPKGAD
jgi:MraZ protein